MTENTKNAAKILGYIISDCAKIVEDGEITIADMPTILKLFNDAISSSKVDWKTLVDDIALMTESDMEQCDKAFYDAFTLTNKEVEVEVENFLEGISEIFGGIKQIIAASKNLSKHAKEV